MFTKSGRKLVRIPISQRNDLPPSNAAKGEPKQNNHVNGHIDNILDDLVSRGCTVTAITPGQTAKEKKSIPPASSIKIPAKLDSLSQTLATENCSKASNDVTPRPQRKPGFVNVPKSNIKTIPSVRTANNQIRNNLPRGKGKNVFDITEIPQFIVDFTAFRAKTSFKAAAPNLQFDDKVPSTKSTGKRTVAGGKIINGTKYVPYTPQSNVVKRERLIQVSEAEIKGTIETAVQCDLIEDDSSSESSESDWINEIMEEYEYLEDNNMYECQICGEVCPNHWSNIKHSMTHKEHSLLCFRCGRLFPNPSKLLEHENKRHVEEHKIKIKKALRCPKLNCLKAFHSKRQLFDHIDQHGRRVTEERCSKCQRSFSSPLQLLCHVNRRNCWR